MLRSLPLLFLGFATVRCDFQQSDCDLFTQSSICLSGGKNLVVKDAVPEGLSAKFTFDDSFSVDSSGHGNHGHGVIGVGTGVGFAGSSAHFQGSDYLEVPHSLSFSGASYSTTFWLNVNRPPRTADCVLLLKGDPTTMDPTPRVSLAFTDAKLHLESSGGISLVSKAKIRPQKWVHVAVARSDTEIFLYVNGVLDVRMAAPTGKGNEGPLYIGGTPQNTCDYDALIDEVRVYQRTLTDVEIAAEASPALGGVRPSFAHLGCTNCTLNAAKNSCREDYHICTAMELYTGAFSVARINGYADWRSNIWTASDLAQSEKEKAERHNTNNAVDAATKHAVKNPAVNSNQTKAAIGISMCCSDIL